MIRCGILAIAAGTKAFLYLNNEIRALGKELSTVEVQAAGANTREQLAASTAEIKDVKAANTQLRAQIEEMRGSVEMLKTRKNNVVAAPPKRR